MQVCCPSGRCGRAPTVRCTSTASSRSRDRDPAGVVAHAVLPPPGPRVGVNPIDEDGGYIIGHNLEPSVCGGGITDSRFVANQTITAKKCGVVANPQLGAGPDEFQIEPKPAPAAPPASRSLRTGR